MTTDISASISLFKSAQEVWEAARDMFASLNNRAAIMEIEAALDKLKQGTLTVTKFWTNLVLLWQQLDMYDTYEWTCPTDAQLYAKIKEEKRIYKFLLSLNPVFDEIRGRIMSFEKLPSLHEVMVKQEESRRKLTVSVQPQQLEPNSSAMYTKGGQSNDGKGRKNNRWCDHCQNQDTPKKYVGKKPSNRGKSRGDSQANTAKIDSEH
ncbi:uncharacterized protein LOC114755786 [Neltuma alba]|uniref:uncharacterized protein LOC114755786 n=1 Tax=Neltuma alba TaxID=207710 RepID=UPI0010A541B6|nr:uncharacterized protein LOC114755786 [Prosopis alba]